MPDRPRRHPDTVAVHAGLPEPEPGKPFLPGPTFASAYHLPGAADSAPFSYNRYGNPTWAVYEQALGTLEDAEAVLFASGMAAVSALLLPLGARDVLVLPSDGYPGARAIASEQLAPRGVEVRPVASEDSAIRAALEGATLLWLETPTNPRLDVCDVAALAAAAREAGAQVVVDNTLATPLAQRPLDLGADVSVSSASKHVTGHSDLLMGWAATRDPDRVAELRAWRGQSGGIPGPFEAWLAHRSLPTLPLRLQRGTANAGALAELLAAREDVVAVRYPGLPGDLSHAVAARQMSGFGTVLGFDVGGAPRAEAFLAACRLIYEATSFGGVHSTAERRGRWGTDDVPEGFIRLSAGCEHPDDLLADVAAALDATR